MADSQEKEKKCVTLCSSHQMNMRICPPDVLFVERKKTGKSVGKEHRIMSQKELLKIEIEKEREKLNALLNEGKSMEEAYGQSLVLDALIVQYMMR